MTFKEKLYRFMLGRYGYDEFYKFLMLIDLVLIVINIFVSSFWLSLAVLAIMFYAIFRTMSRNISRRRAENAKYLSIKWKLRSIFKKEHRTSKNNDKKTHVFRICPSCKAKLRLPRKKGPHNVRCPRCKVLFEVHIR